MAAMEAMRRCHETSRRQVVAAPLRSMVMLSCCQVGAVAVVRVALMQSLPEAKTRQSWVMEAAAAAAMVKDCPEPGTSSHLSSASAAGAAMALVAVGAVAGWATAAESPDRLCHIMTIACCGFC